MNTVYVPEQLGVEVVTPWGYYVPREAAFVALDGRRLLYVLGSSCIEASCCGVGSWDYLRVEGYVVEESGSGRGARPKAAGLNAAGTGVAGSDDVGRSVEIDTVDDPAERAAISALLLQKHPSVRIEFR